MKRIDDHWRLEYHIMPEYGWLNDPNGAMQFNGTYHLYYQYVPENPNGGATHWGHQTSLDLVHFKQEPIFMSPDQVFDYHGVYSGGAIIHNDIVHFFYTGNVKKVGDYDYIYQGREQNVVHVTSRDGYNIDKREVVIPHADFPDGFTDHIRDPKIIEHNGHFNMILGARRIDNRGAILLYRSQDLDHWDYQGELIVGSEEDGYMWECPDLFFIDGQAVLIYSPQGILPTTYRNTHVAGYCLGTVNFEEVIFTRTSDFYELDYGFDFYAPHTFEDETGRRIQWAWMGLGDTMPEYTNPTINRGWQHAMTLPRELKLTDNKLYQLPLSEYQVLRKPGKHYDIEKSLSIDVTSIYELIIDFDEKQSFEILLGEDSKLTYTQDLLTLSHGPSGYGRRKRMIEVTKIMKLHIFVDKSSIEIFINNGEYVMTSRYYPSEDAKQKLDLFLTGKIDYYPLKAAK